LLNLEDQTRSFRTPHADLQMTLHLACTIESNAKMIDTNMKVEKTKFFENEQLLAKNIVGRYFCAAFWINAAFDNKNELFSSSKF